MNTERRNRKVSERHRWIAESVRQLAADQVVEVLRPLTREEIPYREEYGVWFLLAETEPSEETVKKVLKYIDSCSDPMMVCRSNNDLLILPVYCEEKGLPGVCDAFAGVLKELEWPGMLVCASGYEDINDVYRAYRIAKVSWQSAHAIYPDRSWLSSSEIHFGRIVQKMCTDRRMVREAEESLKCLEEMYPNGDPIRFLSCYFLDCGMDLNQTAEKMFLHKNTLKYRRMKINGLLGYQLENVRRSYALVISLAIHRCMEAKGKTV
jgi:sugar diacid utilization regulator